MTYHDVTHLLRKYGLRSLIGYASYAVFRCCLDLATFMVGVHPDCCTTYWRQLQPWLQSRMPKVPCFGITFRGLPILPENNGGDSVIAQILHLWFTVDRLTYHRCVASTLHALLILADCRLIYFHCKCNSLRLASLAVTAAIAASRRSTITMINLSKSSASTSNVLDGITRVEYRSKPKETLVLWWCRVEKSISNYTRL